MKLGIEAKEALIKGINEVANAVKVTMGAEGKTVIIENQMGFAPQVTKDGVTVANAVIVNSDYEKLGADLIKTAANKTVDLVGDGTTTTTVITQELINLGFESLKSGVSHVELRRGMDLAVEDVKAQIKKLKKDVNYQKSVEIASVSANNDSELGELIAKAYDKVGVDGRVEVKEGVNNETTISYGEGMSLDRGWSLPYFCTDFTSMTATLEDCEIIIYDGKIDSMARIGTEMSNIMKKGSPILIIAEDIDEKVMETLVKIKMDGSLRVLVCISPDFGENRKSILEDLAIFTSGVVYDPRIHQEVVTGKAKKVVADRTKTIIMVEDTKTPIILDRVEELKVKIESAEDKFDKEKFQKRLSNIQNAIAIISVGGNNEIEVKEKKDRIDDSVAAVKSALLGGYVAGGGATLLYISKFKMERALTGGEKQGYDIVKKAIQKPFLQILENANMEGLFFEKHIDKYGLGVNVKNREVQNLLKKGIIDSAKVVEVSLENANSVAGLVLQTDCLIVGRGL